MKKAKIHNKKLNLILFLFVVLIAAFFILNPVKKLTSKIGMPAFFDNTTYEEKPLSEAVNTMYVTMMDKKSKVVATTNPNIEVDNNYVFSNDKKPTKQVNTDDTYTILYELADTNDENGYAMMEEGIVYTLELPDYINPQEAFEEPITRKCMNFTKKGKAIACGGIYKEDNKYIFKVKFKDVLNKKDVKANYQYQIKLDKTIEDIVFNVKTINFGLPGAIQLFMEKENNNLEQNYKLVVYNYGNASTTENYQKWLIYINDYHEDGKRIKGSLNIDFGTDMSFILNQNEWFNNIKIYADDVLLTNTRNGTYTTAYSIGAYNGTNELVTIDIGSSSEASTYGGGFVYMMNTLQLDFGTHDGNSAQGVSEWRIEMITTDYHIRKNEIKRDYNLQAAFTDKNNNDEIYQYNGWYLKKYNQPELSFEVSTTQNNNTYSIPKKIEYTANITKTNSNVLEISDVPNANNNSGFNYYINNIGFGSNDQYLAPSIKIYINGTYVNFSSRASQNTVYDFNLPTVYQNVGDMKVYMQMKELFSSYGNGKNYVFRSDSKNPDNEYYWIVLSENTLSNAVTKPSLITDGTNSYRKNNPNAKGIYEPADWKIYLINASNQDVKVVFEEYLDSIDQSKQSIESTSASIVNEFAVNNSTDSSNKISQSATFSIPSLQPMKAYGEWVDDSTIKWNVEIDFEAMNLNPDYLVNYKLYVYTPLNQSMRASNALNYCKNAECNYIAQNQEFKPFNGNHDDDILFDILNSNNFNRYETGSTGLKYFSNGKLRLNFETKIDSYKTTKNDDSFENIYIDFIGNKYEYDGASAPHIDINLMTQAGAYIPKIEKKSDDTYFKDNKENNFWIITANLYNDLKQYKKIYQLDQMYPKKYKTNLPIHYNGTFTTSDKFVVNNNNDKVIAKNTTIVDTWIYVYELNGYGASLKLSDYTKVDGNKYYYDFNVDGKIKRVWIESNNPTNDINMYDGVTFKVGGIERGTFIRIQYRTELDVEKAMSELSFDSTKKTQKYSISNEAKWNVVPNLIGSNLETNIKVSDSANYDLLADLSIDKSINIHSDTNYINDTKSHEVISTIGYNSTKYLDITDFIDGISNLKYNSDTKKYDKEDLSTELSKLKEIRKYTDISNLKIDIKGHYKHENYQNIYSNGSFTSAYSGSTLEYMNNSNELYKLHLVRSDGEDIPALTDIKITYDMVFNPDKEDNYRLKDIYKGGKFYISTNVEGIRTYTPSANGNAQGMSYTNKNIQVKLLSSQDGNYENKIDTTNNTLTAYASNSAASIGADYLKPPTITKNETGNLTNNGQSEWQLTYNVNSTGKNEKTDINIHDEMSFKIDGNSTYNDQIIAILRKYVKYKDINVYYNGRNTSINDNPIYSYNGVLNSNQNISSNNITGILKANTSSYELELSSFNYGDLVIVTYGIDLDFESAYQEMLEKEYIDSSYKLKDTNELLRITYMNKANNRYYQESFIEKSGSKVSVTDFMPTIHKQSKGTINDETSWEVNFNTGTNSSDIKVIDQVEVLSDDEDLKDLIEKSLMLKDLEIKIGEHVIYTNNEFIDNWEDNITISNNNLGYTFTFKDTPNNKFISDNKKVIITYKTGINKNKYNGKKSGLFSLNNKATITKNNLSSEDEVGVSAINYDFPVTVNKEFVGNNTDLTETNWKINIDSGKINRHNLVISDTASLGMEFGKYLSISKLKVTLNDEVIYDSENNINLNLLNITDKDNHNLILNKNGVYEFNIKLDELDNLSNIVIEYTLKIDKDEYVVNDEILDNELLINNNVKVTSDDGTDISSNSSGSSKVLSKLTKQFEFLGYEDGNPKIRWYIDVNLKDNYNLEELTDKEVTITDELSDILELVNNTLKINERSITSNGIQIGSIINIDKYEFNLENNTIKIKLLDPISTNNIRISFDTVCLASISEIENYASLQVGDKVEEIKSSRDIRIFSKYAVGIISSREVLEYRINAKKYLDNKLSNKSFNFSLIEVEENGDEIENGFKTINTNSEDGSISFNTITFDTEGFHYFKIKEVKGNEEDIIYDDKEYLLRIKTVENRGSMVVDDIKLMDSAAEEIIFNNQTKQKEENNNPNVLINPKTGSKILIIIATIVLIIGIGTDVIIKKSKNII